METVLNVARCALMEWLDDVCKPCWGRGYMVPKDAPVATHACTTCNGTGRKRHPDNERARGLGLGVDIAKKWEPIFARAHAFISAADRRTWIEVATQLERITGHKGLVAQVEKVLALRELCGNMNVESQHSHASTCIATVADKHP